MNYKHKTLCVNKNKIINHPKAANKTITFNTEVSIINDTQLFCEQYIILKKKVYTSVNLYLHLIPLFIFHCSRT